MNTAGQPAQGPSIFAGAARVDVDPERLRPTLEDIALHAAGEGFALTGEMRTTVLELLPRVTRRVAPRFAYAAQRVARLTDSRLVLTNGIGLPFGLSALTAEPSGLVAAVCTMGPEADGLRTELGLERVLDAWLLDAVLLTQLELLEALCHQDISRRAAVACLRVGPALVPGIAGVPAPAQQVLFECLGDAAAGVALNTMGSMVPLKSFSCWFPLRTGPAEDADGMDLCGHCDLGSCTFRRRGSETGMHASPKGGARGRSA